MNRLSYILWGLWDFLLDLWEMKPYEKVVLIMFSTMIIQAYVAIPRSHAIRMAAIREKIEVCQKLTDTQQREIEHRVKVK